MEHPEILILLRILELTDHDEDEFAEVARDSLQDHIQFGYIGKSTR